VVQPPKKRRRTGRLDEPAPPAARLGSLELHQQDLEALEALRDSIGIRRRVELIRYCIRLGGLLGRLRSRGVLHFGYLNARGEFVPLPSLFW